MNEHQFLSAVQAQAEANDINPLLLISGIEGLYTFRDVPANAINFELLDNLILTIFALRIGDTFDEIARKNLDAEQLQARVVAEWELGELAPEEIAESNDAFLQSFAKMVGSQTPVRRYHRKALDVAALEIRKAQLQFENNSIGAITFGLCQGELKDSLHLAALFSR